MENRQAVFVRNPFIQPAGWYEAPKIIIKNNWVTEKYGFEVFTSSNPVYRWIYIVIREGLAFMATPEAFEDKAEIENYIKYIEDKV